MITRESYPCEADPELFFRERPDLIAEAKDMCARCPIIDACRELALANHEAGTWGGTTEQERFDILRARQQAATSHRGSRRRLGCAA